jgi:hypothetical protein
MNNTFLLSIYLPGYTISLQGAKIIINNDKKITSNNNYVRELEVYLPFKHYIPCQTLFNLHKPVKEIEKAEGGRMELNFNFYF